MAETIEQIEARVRGLEARQDAAENKANRDMQEARAEARKIYIMFLRKLKGLRK
jgi:vacuolar-type H+-ATPase subunit H